MRTGIYELNRNSQIHIRQFAFADWRRQTFLKHVFSYPTTAGKSSYIFNPPPCLVLISSWSPIYSHHRSTIIFYSPSVPSPVSFKQCCCTHNVVYIFLFSGSFFYLSDIRSPLLCIILDFVTDGNTTLVETFTTPLFSGKSKEVKVRR